MNGDAILLLSGAMSLFVLASLPLKIAMPNPASDDQKSVTKKHRLSHIVAKLLSQWLANFHEMLDASDELDDNPEMRLSLMQAFLGVANSILIFLAGLVSFVSLFVSPISDLVTKNRQLANKIERLEQLEQQNKCSVDSSGDPPQ